MLKHAKTTGILLIILGAAGLTAFGQRSVRLNAAPEEFQTFYKKFVRAVHKGNGPEIAQMTSFPFNYGFDAGDEGVWSRKEFFRNYRKIFKPQPRVFKKTNPEFTRDGGSFTLTNGDDASYFTFKRQGGVYKLISYIVEP